METAEIQQVRGLAGAGPIELPCLVDQVNCGEVYYITWTKQALLPNSSTGGPQAASALSVQLQQQQQPWSRVYLYTGANDSSPHKPIGDLLARASFIMPEKAPAPLPATTTTDEDRPGVPLARLVIEDPRLSDEALYKCDVTYVKGKCPSISLVRVQVMALPSKAQIVGQLTSSAGGLSGPIGEGQLIGPYNEHEQLRLACLVYGGRPQPKSVIWRKIDASGRTINLQSTISRQQQQMVGNQNMVELNLNHTLTSADLGAKFECHVEHEAIEEPPARVVVSAGGGEFGGQARLPAGPTDALLDLHPSGVRPPHGGLGGADHRHSDGPRSKSLDSHVFVDLNVGVASLDLFMAKVNKMNSSESLREGDLVELECVAYNSKPPANITWFNGPESIEQLDPTTATASVAQQLAAPGDTATSAPAPSAGFANNWHQQHKLRHKRLLQRNQVHQNSDGQTYNTHSFLSIKLSRHEHKAQISCKAQNGPMRQPTVKSLELQVEHAPIVLMEPAAGITVNESPSSNLDHQQQQPSSDDSGHVITMSARQAAASIYCIYSANPTELLPNSTRWFKDGQPLQVGGQVSRPDELTGAEMEPDTMVAAQHLTESLTPTGYPVLTIHRVTRRDAGRYECQLANSVGQSERLPASESCRLEVNFRPSVQLRLFRPTKQRSGPVQTADQLGDLTEIDLEQELVLPGSSLVLSCEVLEAQPSRIHKFHWFKGPVPRLAGQAHATPPEAALSRRSNSAQGGEQTTNDWPDSSARQQQLMGVTESGQFVLQSLAANFTPQSYSCSAFNSLGPSDRSQPMDIQLSYTPGPPFVRPVNDPTLRKTILASGRPTRTSSVIDSSDSGANPQPVPAGRELLLECVTPDLGQPRANIWLWFRNGNPIESSPSLPLSNRFPNTSNNPSTTIETEASPDGDLISSRDDNPITGQQQQGDSSPIASSSAPYSKRRGNGPEPPPQDEATARDQIHRPLDQQHSSNVRLISSGRYLFIPSIQLVHKGNYSCVAVNRFGSSQKLQQQTGGERDSYQLSVLLAPSFVQPLASRTYWPETSMSAEQSMTTSTIANGPVRQLELVCHIQCEPICQIEWLRNNDPLDLKRHSESLSSNYVTYQVKQTIFDENLEANLFKSIESRLVIQFLHNPLGHHQHSGGPQQQQQLRDKVLERRALLSGSNYTCQSSPNTMGPPVRSTTKFIVQYQPENVLINAPSDKLSLIEGSNGPSLSCEASGEPQVQYRWFLLKSGSGSDWASANSLAIRFNGQKVHPSRDAITQSYSSKAAASNSSNTEQSVGGAIDRRSPIDQMANKAFIGASSSTGGVNDVEGIEQNLIELTGSATEQAGGSFSTLDLSNLSLDRKQTGRYICEASNRLGQSRNSVYVNVLYKPTCATLHLHSLDLIMMPTLDKNTNLIKSSRKQEVNHYRYRPYKSSTNDEYLLARETSEDFIGLRKVLVLSPLLNRYPTTTSSTDDELSFKGSIFQTILNNNNSNRIVQDLAISSSSVIGDDKKVSQQFKDTDALIHMDKNAISRDREAEHNLFISASDIDSNRQSNHIENSSRLNSTGDSWDKFNMLLLKFLNSYMKQVKTFEENTIDAATRKSRNTHTSRQSNQEDFGTNLRDDIETNSNVGATRNLLTFACMAQDASPTNDLIFDWSFGSMSLPETSEVPLNIDGTNYIEQEQNKGLNPPKPVLVYANENYTIHIMLVRRLDTKSSLNPFQLSLLTLNVVVEPQMASSHSIAINRMARQARESLNNRTNETNRSPIVRHRYQQSLYNSLRGSQATSNGNNNNIQFAQEFETKPYNLVPNLELNEQNWQEQLGNLLKCRVTNQIGTSDVCHVRINIAERLKSQSSSSEFAKWRMPSLANKSLLIISIMVGCALIIFVATALLLGPHLRELSNKKKNDTMRRREDNNTGQSTCSQKSSVLGLLGNGDSSIQGSSDDDSSARMNHIDLMSKNRPETRMVDLDDMSISKTVANGYHHHNHLLSQELGGSYDEPRSLRDSRSVYNNSCNFNVESRNHNEMINAGDLDSIYRHGAGDSVNGNGTTPTNQVTTDSTKTVQGSTGSRLLANLKFKSLSKFKVDRISDLSSFAGRMDQLRGMHNKNVSNSETSTTGLSVPSLGDISIKMTSPTSTESSGFLASLGSRHSHLDFKRPTVDALQKQQIYSLDQSAHMFNKNGLQSEQDTQAIQLSSRRLMNATTNTMLPAYSNTVDYDAWQPGRNALDEFIRQREVAGPIAISGQAEAAAFYRSQSVKNQSANQALHMLKNDLNQLYPLPMNRGPPVYPRTHQSSTMYRSRPDDNRPAIVTRSSHRHMIDTNTASRQPYPHINSRFSMPPYHQTFNISEPPMPSVGYMDTIDSHLNRFTENAANGDYLNQNTAYANALNSASYNQDLYNNVSNQNLFVEHIYDVNAYATPEQTPQRAPIVTGQDQSSPSERLRVSQLIQTFNSKAPE